MGKTVVSGEASRRFPCLFLAGEKGLEVYADGSVWTGRALDLEVDDRAEVDGRDGSRGEVARRSA